MFTYYVYGWAPTQKQGEALQKLLSLSPFIEGFTWSGEEQGWKPVDKIGAPISGYHFNLRLVLNKEYLSYDSMMKELLQENLTWTDGALDKVPKGYESLTKIRFFDPATIKTPTNVIA